MKLNIFKSSVFLVAAVIIVSMFFSCGGGSKEKKKGKKDSIVVKKETVCQVNEKLNDIALYLAGMKLNEKSELFELTKNPSWVNYARNTDTSWSKLGRKRTRPMSAWAKREMPDLIKDLNTLFYPFSGPDFLHANALFPYAKKMILFGMEPVGDIPDFKKLKKEEITPYFAYITKSLQDITNLSFFKTINMSSDFSGSKVNGTLPVIMLFIARAGYEIADIKPVMIDTTGQFVDIPAFKDYKGEKSYNYGVKVKYINPKDSIGCRTLYYFSCNIIDQGVAASKNTRMFLQKLDTGVVTFIKSASYLMHNTYFSAIRNTCFAKSKAILQDDSGIAYKYYEKNKWKINLYGVYTGPIDMFANRYEKDLKEAFTKEKVGTFTFKYGYGTNSNMLLARKIK